MLQSIQRVFTSSGLFLTATFLSLISALQPAQAAVSADYFSNTWPETARITHSAGQTLLRVVKPNSKGISYNRLGRIDVGINGLHLINSASLNSSLDGGEADFIILEVSDYRDAITLSGTVALVGKAADVIILAPSAGQIICNGCRFKSIPRLTLATGAITLDSDGGLLGVDAGSGTITIGAAGLRAVDTHALDVLSSNISLLGEINTQPRGRYNLGGELEIDPSGPLKLAAGKVSLIQGVYRYFYQSGAIGEIDLDAAGQLVTGKDSMINAGDIHLESTSRSKTFSLAGLYSTKSDLSLAGIYRGNNVLPAKKIYLKSVSSIDMSAQLQSGSSVEVLSGAGLSLVERDGTTGVIDATRAELAVVSDFVNLGVINATEIQLAASRVSNQGEIWAEQKAFLFGQQSLHNHFGGLLVSRFLTLSSEGEVINGAKEAFRLVGRPNQSLSVNAFGDLPDGYMLQQSDNGQSVVMDENNVAASYTNQENLSAVIIGYDVDIHANSFSNLNPYFTSNYTSNADFVLDPTQSGQVLLSAEGKLVIDTKLRIENRSAIIEGQRGLHLVTQTFENTRFKIAVNRRPADQMPRDACIKLRSCWLPARVTLGISAIEGYFSYVSPAARILSGNDTGDGGDASIQATTFENANSYFEVLGNLELEVDNVRNVGTTLQTDIDATLTTHHSRRYCKRRILGKCVSRKTYHWTTQKSLQSLETGDSLPALVVVEGHLRGTGAEAFDVIVKR